MFCSWQNISHLSENWKILYVPVEGAIAQQQAVCPFPFRIFHIVGHWTETWLVTAKHAECYVSERFDSDVWVNVLLSVLNCAQWVFYTVLSSPYTVCKCFMNHVAVMFGLHLYSIVQSVLSCDLDALRF